MISLSKHFRKEYKMRKQTQENYLDVHYSFIHEKNSLTPNYLYFSENYDLGPTLPDKKKLTTRDSNNVKKQSTQC